MRTLLLLSALGMSIGMPSSNMELPANDAVRLASLGGYTQGKNIFVDCPATGSALIHFKADPKEPRIGLPTEMLIVPTSDVAVFIGPDKDAVELATSPAPSVCTTGCDINGPVNEKFKQLFCRGDGASVQIKVQQAY